MVQSDDFCCVIRRREALSVLARQTDPDIEQKFDNLTIIYLACNMKRSDAINGGFLGICLMLHQGSDDRLMTSTDSCKQRRDSIS